MVLDESDNLSLKFDVPYSNVVNLNYLFVEHSILFIASCTQVDSGTQ